MEFSARSKYLLVNPWIADVAAYNFWIRPLGLYRIAEWIHERGGDVFLLDCLSPFTAPAKFPREPVAQPDVLVRKGMRRRFCRYGIPVDEFRNRVRSAGKVAAVLVTSAMSYWYPGMQWAVDEIKQLISGVPVIAGGVYPTLWPGHARRFSGADHVLCGPLESCQAELAGLLGLPQEPVRERLPWYRLGLHDAQSWTAVRTACGCPYRCTYCASRLVSGKFRQRSPGEIFRELETLYGYGVRDISFYDDALLVDFQGRLGPVLEMLLKRGIQMRFHVPNAMHAALVDRSTASILRKAGFKTVRLGLETVDRVRQAESGGKVRTGQVEKAVNCLRSAGFSRREIGVYLLAGLPGQDTGEVRDGIEFVRQIGATPFIAELSPIPGTEVWSQLEKTGQVHYEMDPVLTNNSLFWEISGFCSPAEFHELKSLCRH